MSTLAEHMAFLRAEANAHGKGSPWFQVLAWNLCNGHLDELEALVSDSDGTATAAVCEDIPVPKGLPSAGPKDIAQQPPNEYPHP